MAKQDLLIVSEDGKNIKHYSYQAAEAARRDGKTLIPLRAFQLADGTVKHVSYERSPEMIEQWTAQGLQPMEVAKSWDAERREIVAQSIAERDAERTAEANAGRWGEAFGNYGLAVGGESVKKFVGNPAKAFVGLSQLTNAGLGWLTSLGGLAPNPVSNLFHGSAAENAKVRESIEHVEEKYLSKSKPVEGQLGAVGKVTHQVTEGVTDLASQILIGGTTGKVATALKGTSAIAPAASVAAPGKLTVGKMVANAGKSMVKDGGAAYATMMAGEAAGETLAEAARNKVDPNKAFEIGALDFATSYFLATADAMVGGISQAAGKVGLEKTPIKSWFMNGLKNPSTQATIKRVLRNIAWEGTSEAADQYLHLTRLQDAGFQISQEDKLVAAAQAGLYGAVGGGIAEGAGYLAARSELQVERKKFALQKQLEAEAALARAQAGQPVETSTPGGPARVNPTGSVEFKDGSTVHPDGTMTTVNGVVTDGEGQPMTVRPEAGESETFDLFNLIRNSDLKVYNLPIETIAVNDRIKQFKQDADPTSGVVQGERLTGAYNPIPAKPILVMEFADGHREVVTGRHRIDLAKQNRMAQIPANVIYEKDGWTLEQARMMDAYDNILDGKGSDQDFVNFFRTAKLDEKTLAEHPELYGRKRQAEARLVAEQASEDLYSLFMSKDERMPLDTAAAIAREAPIGSSGYAENIQRAVTRAALHDGIRASDAAIMARSLMQAYRQRIEAKGMQQLDLFGDDESFQLAMTLEAKFASSKVREIETDLRALKQATGKQSGNLKAREALLKKYGLESAEDADGMQRVIEDLEENKRRWQNYYSDPELAQQAHAYAKKTLHLDDVAVEMPDGTITTVNQEVTAPETTPAGRPVQEVIQEGKSVVEAFTNEIAPNSVKVDLEKSVSTREKLLNLRQELDGFAGDEDLENFAQESIHRLPPPVLWAVSKPFEYSKVEEVPQGLFTQHAEIKVSDDWDTVTIESNDIDLEAVGREYELYRLLENATGAEMSPIEYSKNKIVIHGFFDGIWSDADASHLAGSIAEQFPELLIKVDRKFSDLPERTVTYVSRSLPRGLVRTKADKPAKAKRPTKKRAEPVPTDPEGAATADDPNQDMLFSPMPRRSKLEPTEMAGRFTLEGEPDVKVDIEKGRTVVSGLETAANPSKAVDAVVAEAREMGTPLTVANPEKLTNTQRAAIETHNASDLKPSEQPLQAKHEDALPRSTLENTLFPNGGQLPVAGSPAAQAGMVPLALHHVVGIYRALAGRYPKVVKDRNRGPQTALAWFKPDTQSIAVRAQLFGLADGSDVNLLKEKLRERGFFRHEDPKWVGSQTNKVVDYEKRVSEQRLRQDLSDLVNKRIKAGIHQGVGTKVMAHELWHYIDQLDGVEVREHGNFLGHILNLKKNTARVLPETDFTNNKELVAEATAFIPWWRGTEGTKDIEYFTKHPWEMYAEMGAAFWLDPGSVCEKAPNYFRAMMIGMEAHPLAYDAWMKAQEAIKNKSDLSGLMAKLTETWSREAETERRRLKDRLRHRPREGNVWQRFKEWMSGSHSAMNFHRWATDRHAPIVMVVNNAATEYVKRMKRLAEQGKVSQADYEKAEAAAKAAIEDINYLKVQYTHQYGKSKIYLADLSEKVIKASRKLGVEMDELGKYLHLQRVIEIGDRATALGIDAPTAHKALNEMASTLGPAKMKKVRAMAHQFRAIYEQAVINNPQVREMLGKKNMELLEKNKHYVTMRHVDDAGQVADLHEQLDRSKHAHDPLTLAIAQIAQVGGGLSTEAGYRLRRLTGSFRATSNPVTATAQTAVAIIEAAQKNAVMIDLAQSLQTFEMPDFKLLKPGERAVENERFGVIPFMLNGEPRKMIVPREVADAATERNFNIPFLSAFTRFLNAGHTTNNYTFVPTAYERDLSATAINNKGLMRSPLHFLSAFNLGGVARLIPGKVGATVGGALDLGGYAAMASQFIPPHVMKSISKHPVGKLLFNPSTIEYWTSYGHKMARMIQKGEYEQTLQEAKAAREAGDITKAEELEYCVCMARKALEDGVLLTLRQMRTDDHTKSDLKQLFDRYNIAFEDDVDTMPLPEKLYKVLKDEKQWGTAAWQAARKAAVAYWEGAGNFSEVEEMTTKLAGYCALHNMATDGQQKFSDEKRKQIALQTATMIGSPDFASRGLIAQFIEMSTSAFWNARMRGGIRMVRAAWNSPGAWFAKAAIHAAPTVTALLVSSGVARRLIVRLLTDDDDERKLEGTVGGQVVEALRWQEKALRNVSLYTQRNSRCLPIWSDGETTLSLKLPIPDEAKLIDGSVRAMWNNLGLPSTDPNYNFDEVITTLGQQFAFNPSDRGSLWSFATPFLSPLVFGSNPYETYRNAPMYTEDAFKARFLEPAPFLEQMGKKTWNASPFVQLYRFRTTDGNPGPDALGELQALMRIPGLGPMLMRFASIDSGGRIQTLKEYERMDEAHRAANRLRQESAARKLTAGEPWDEDEARAVLMDYNRVKRLMLNMNKPNAVRTFESLKRIKDPEVMRRAMESTL